MPPAAYPTRLLSERQLGAWYDRSRPADKDRHARTEAIWQRLREQCGDSPELTQAYFDLDELEGERLFATEEELLLIAGSLCVRSGQHELWTAIYNAVHGGPYATETPGQEFAFLEDATARARAGQL